MHSTKLSQTQPNGVPNMSSTQRAALRHQGVEVLALGNDTDTPFDESIFVTAFLHGLSLLKFGTLATITDVCTFIALYALVFSIFRFQLFGQSTDQLTINLLPATVDSVDGVLAKLQWKGTGLGRTLTPDQETYKTRFGIYLRGSGHVCHETIEAFLTPEEYLNSDPLLRARGFINAVSGSQHMMEQDIDVSINSIAQKLLN